MSFNSEINSFKHSIKETVDEFGHQLSEDTNENNFIQKLQTIYENNVQNSDFKIIFGSNGESLLTHKLVLIVNNCQTIESMDKSIESIEVKDVSEMALKSVIKSFYYLKQSLQMNVNTIDDYIKIAEQLGNDLLLDKCLKYKQKIMILNEKQNKINTFVTQEINDLKRNWESIDLLYNKRHKSFESSPNTWIPMSELNHSIDESFDGNQTNERSDITAEPKSSPSVVTEQALSECSSVDTDFSLRVTRSSDMTVIKTKVKRSKRLTKISEIIGNDYQFLKFLDLKSEKDTNVWNSCLFPNLCHRYEVMATVGGTQVNWFALNKDLPLLGTFMAPNHKILRSIAFSQIKVNNRSVNMCAIGSTNCIYFTIIGQNPEVYKTLTGFDDDVNSIAFHPTDPYIMFCGDSNKSVQMIKLSFDCTGLLDESKCEPLLEFSFKTPVLSILYLEEFDCLVVSGESRDLMICFNISDEKNRWFGKTTPNEDINLISGMTYISGQKLIVFRCYPSDNLLTARVDKMFDKECLQSLRAKGKSDSEAPINIPFVPSARLKHSKPTNSVEFINLSCSSGLIGCGDHCGHVYLYDSTQLNEETVKPIAILGNDINWTDSQNPPIIRSVVISEDKQYITSTTNSNRVLVWKRKAEKLSHF